MALVHAERFSWHTEFIAVQVSVISFPWPAFLHFEECVCVCVCVCVYIYIYIYIYRYIFACVETVYYELPLLLNNTASETFLHKSGAVLSVDWIFIIGTQAQRWWLGKYMILDKMFYNLLFKQEVVTAPSYFHIFFLITFLEEAFNRSIIIILCNFYTV
jgi:hypothetical protein